MLNALSSSAIWQLVQQSDWVSKYVVLLGLFVLSVACVAIMLFKFVVLRAQRARLANLMEKMKLASSLNQVKTLAQAFQGSYGGTLVKRALDTYAFLQKSSGSTLTPEHGEHLELLMNQHVSTLMLEGEEYLPVLGTSAAVSPLIGLFGTIWGLIHAFVNISQEKVADISIVAPGIAEALLTNACRLDCRYPGACRIPLFF